VNEDELRQLASWSRQSDAIADAEERLAAARKAARQISEELAELRQKEFDSCPLELDDLAYRFWSKVTIVDDSDSCWEFTGSRRPVAGEEYGMFRMSSDMKYPIGAHRVAFFLTTGTLPTVGRHTCDNPPCVRPSHILDGTHTDNMRDRSIRGRARARHQRGEANASAVLTDDLVIRARQMVKAGRTHRAVAEDLGVKRDNLTHAVTGRTWTHLNAIESPAPVRRGGSRLTENDVRAIRKGREEGVSAQALAERYGLSTANVYAIARRQSWKHVQ